MSCWKGSHAGKSGKCWLNAGAEVEPFRMRSNISPRRLVRLIGREIEGRCQSPAICLGVMAAFFQPFEEYTAAGT